MGGARQTFHFATLHVSRGTGVRRAALTKSRDGTRGEGPTVVKLRPPTAMAWLWEGRGEGSEEDTR